jgi:cytochrome c peroxidase
LLGHFDDFNGMRPPLTMSTKEKTMSQVTRRAQTTRIRRWSRLIALPAALPTAGLAGVIGVTAAAASCSSGEPRPGAGEGESQSREELQTEDGLKEAYAVFKPLFEAGLQQAGVIGLPPPPPPPPFEGGIDDAGDFEAGTSDAGTPDTGDDGGGFPFDAGGGFETGAFDSGFAGDAFFFDAPSPDAGLPLDAGPPLDAGQSEVYIIGFGFHPGLSTEKLTLNQNPVNGQVAIGLDSGDVTARLAGPPGHAFDLYFVKNTPGEGTVKPEPFDQIFKVGTFHPDPNVPNSYILNAHIGKAPFPKEGVNFDLDMVVVTFHEQSPTTSILATGARTLFEKRFFRERARAAPDPVTGPLANFVETNDPLVRRGAELFQDESFEGNGRRCATCHPLGHNQTIDPAFVAALPATDPLFHFPTGLEDSAMLKHSLIRENVDGFDDLAHRFVQRGVPHTLSMSTSLGVVGTGLGQSDVTPPRDGPPPDQRTGWSGDGAPGRGTLSEFAFGAIVQHYPKTLSRQPGVDFRIPTQEELDALEAFQMFNGRQSTPKTFVLTLGDPAAQAGLQSANGEGACSSCHLDLSGVVNANPNLNTGVENLPLSFRTAKNMPKDGGFGLNHIDGTPGTVETGFGNGTFNAPPLFEVADTPPFFHNGAISTVEEAVAFYQSQQFLRSPGANFVVPVLTPQSIQNIGAFLRTINALENIAQVRKRAQYLARNATPGGLGIVTLAINDTDDAIRDLSAPNLSANASVTALIALRAAKESLQDALPNATRQPTDDMNEALAQLEIAKRVLLPGNPNNDF